MYFDGRWHRWQAGFVLRIHLINSFELNFCFIHLILYCSFCFDFNWEWCLTNSTLFLFSFLSIIVPFIYRKRSLSDCQHEDLDNTRDSVLSDQSSFSATEISNEPELMIIDFEYCAYNYRGFDLANHFIEWMIDYTNKEFPFFFYKKEQYPNKEQQVIYSTNRSNPLAWVQTLIISINLHSGTIFPIIFDWSGIKSQLHTNSSGYWWA